MQPPGWALLTGAARDAVLEELCDLPEDIGPACAREPSPACARVNEVIDALVRAARYVGVTDGDRTIIAAWQTLMHAAPIAMFLDLATVGAYAIESAVNDISPYLHDISSRFDSEPGGTSAEEDERRRREGMS